MRASSGNERLVEVKRVVGRRIFWSEPQIETAQNRPGSYFMALVEPKNEGAEYEVFWLWDPLTQLRGLNRGIRWMWKEQRSLNGISEGWKPLEMPPARCADSFKAVVELTDEFQDSLEHGVETLMRKIGSEG